VWRYKVTAVVKRHQQTPYNIGFHQEGRRVFWEGPKFFELYPIFSNYIQHIFTILVFTWNYRTQPWVSA